MAISAYLVKQLFDVGFKPGHAQELAQICLEFVGIYAVSGVFRFFNMYILLFTAEKITVQMQKDLQQKYMVLSYRFHNLSDSGGYISRIINDVSIVKEGLKFFADSVREPFSVIVLLGYVLWLNPKLTLTLFLVTPFLGIILGRVGRSVRKYSYTQQETLEQFTSTLKETFDGLRVIQSFNLEQAMRKRLAKVGDTYLEARRKIITRQEFASPLTEFIGVLVFAGTCYYIVTQTSENSVGGFISYIAALGYLQQPIKKLQETYVRLQQTVASNERIFSVLEDARDVPEVARPVAFDPNWDKIVFDRVSFSYGNEKVLKGVSLEVKRGQVIALIGESGSGKSTMMNLFERFIDPDEGEIRIGGTRIQDLSLQVLRHQIGLVTQDVFLFNETIDKCIRSGLPEDMATGPQVMSSVEAAKLANAIDFIERRPLKFQTMVGERGSALSGGEKQRISIARAIFKNAPILILDEATSALDSASEVEVQKGLDRLMEGRTTFVIAHRLSTVLKADRILVLERGQIVEDGTHAELLKRQGAYYQFYKLQVPHYAEQL